MKCNPICFKMDANAEWVRMAFFFVEAYSDQKGKRRDNENTDQSI